MPLSFKLFEFLKYSFSANIQYLLRWRRIKNEEIKEALDALVNVSPDEIVKVKNYCEKIKLKVLSSK